ncbi:MAG: hypothetical protein KGM42_06670 [Hyphomicrobiales bacterium]|nr:hypothetical protein [Hyphomicrobiales bacterium]
MATMIIPSRAYGAPIKRTAPGPGLWTKFIEAVKASRQAEAERIVAQYSAGRWSDSVEREINDKLVHHENLRAF